MATINKTRTAASTLVGSTADTVNLLQVWDRIEINNATAAAMYARFDLVTATAAADGAVLINGSSSKTFTVPPRPGGVAGSTTSPCHTISLVGTDNAYTVTGYAGY